MNSIQFSQQQSVDYKTSTTSKSQPKIPLLLQFKQAIQTDTQPHKMRWNERAIYRLNQWETKLESAMPNFEFQNKIDAIGRYIKKKFAPLKEFNRWLDSNGHGAWHVQLATFLAKLPARAIRNIVKLVYQIIKTILYGVTHPLKSLTRLAKLIVSLIDALTKPETWSKIGAGMIGASLGQTAITGNPISLIGAGIGGALLIGGLSAGALKTAVEAQKGQKFKAVKEHLFMQAKQIPEPMLTGFFMGLLFGGIQRAVNQSHQGSAAPQTQYRITTMEEAQQYAKQFIKDNNLPDNWQVALDPSSGKVTIYWKNGPHFPVPKDDWYVVQHANITSIELSPSYSQVHVHVHAWDGFEGVSWKQNHSLEGVGFVKPAYPSSSIPLPTTLKPINLERLSASATGASEAFRSTMSN